jgi:putative transposase
MQRFTSVSSAQQFLSRFSRTHNLFRPRRHLLPATDYRTTLQASFRTWREGTGVVCP